MLFTSFFGDSRNFLGGRNLTIVGSNLRFSVLVKGVHYWGHSIVNVNEIFFIREDNYDCNC